MASPAPAMASSAQTEPDRLSALAPELLQQVFSYLPVKDLIACRSVTRHFKDTVDIQVLRCVIKFHQDRIRDEVDCMDNLGEMAIGEAFERAYEKEGLLTFRGVIAPFRAYERYIKRYSDYTMPPTDYSLELDDAWKNLENHFLPEFRNAHLSAGKHKDSVGISVQILRHIAAQTKNKRVLMDADSIPSLAERATPVEWRAWSIDELYRCYYYLSELLSPNEQSLLGIPHELEDLLLQYLISCYSWDWPMYRNPAARKDSPFFKAAVLEATVCRG